MKYALKCYEMDDEKVYFLEEEKTKGIPRFLASKVLFGGVKNIKKKIGGEEPENDCFGFFYTFKNIYIYFKIRLESNEDTMRRNLN